jgi:invasion protein IalB
MKWDISVRRIRAGAISIALSGCFAAGFAGAPPARAQGAVKATHGAWETRCETPPGADREQCAILQSVVDEDRPNITLVVIVLKTADRKSRLMRVIAPLGVLLPTGLGLMIDETKVGTTGFARCNPHGCIAEAIMDDKLLDQLKTGKNATFIVHETPDKGVGLPVTLAGFKEGFAKLP